MILTLKLTHTTTGKGKPLPTLASDIHRPTVLFTADQLTGVIIACSIYLYSEGPRAPLRTILLHVILLLIALFSALLSNIAIAPKVRPHYDVKFIVVYEIILCLTLTNQSDIWFTKSILSEII